MTASPQVPIDPLMATTSTTKAHWPLVVTLFILLAVPGIPALLLIFLLLFHFWLPAELLQLLNPAYVQTPLPILLHGLSGVVFFLTVPLQFSPGLRQKWPRWHRQSGRVGVGSALLMATSGIWMHHFLTPVDLGMRYAGLWLLSLVIIGCFAMAFVQARQRRFAEHQRWMLRGVAAVLAPVSALLFEAMVYLTFGQVEGWQAGIKEWLHEYARLSAFALNVLALEYYFHRKPASRHPSLGRL